MAYNTKAKIKPSLCCGHQEDVNELYWTYEKFILEATREVIACIKESTIIQQESKNNSHIALEVRGTAYRWVAWSIVIIDTQSPRTYTYYLATDLATNLV